MSGLLAKGHVQTTSWVKDKVWILNINDFRDAYNEFRENRISVGFGIASPEGDVLQTIMSIFHWALVNEPGTSNLKFV